MRHAIDNPVTNPERDIFYSLATWRSAAPIALHHPVKPLRSAPLVFDTTRWSLVLAAGGDDSAAARAALSSLCEAYWYPLYAYIRRRGTDAEDARDLTQSFLASLIERQDFKNLDQTRGR